MESIKAIQLVRGDRFKTSLKQRNFRTVGVIYPFKEGDTETLRGKVLVCQPDCSQIVLPENEEVFREKTLQNQYSGDLKTAIRAHVGGIDILPPISSPTNGFKERVLSV